MLLLVYISDLLIYFLLILYFILILKQELISELSYFLYFIQELF